MKLWTLIIMKIVIILFALLFCCSCFKQTSTQPATVVFEKHEYFKIQQYGFYRYSYTHKGNCTTCEQRLYKIEQSIASNSLALLLTYKELKEINKNMGIKEE